MPPKGKYAHVIDKLPKMSMVSDEHYEIVEVIKKQIRTASDPEELTDVSGLLDIIDSHVKDLTILLKLAAPGNARASEYAKVYSAIRRIKNQFSTWESNFNLLLEAYTALMVEQFEEEGVTSLRLSNGGLVSTHEEPYASVKDKEAFRLWCLKQGMERDMHLHPSKMQSLTREMLLEGAEEAPGITVWAKTKVRLSQGDENDD